MAICFDLLTEQQREQAAANLVGTGGGEGHSLSVGFLGVNLLLPALTEIGRSDLAYRLIQNKPTRPGAIRLNRARPRLGALEPSPEGRLPRSG